MKDFSAQLSSKISEFTKTQKDKAPKYMQITSIVLTVFFLLLFIFPKLIYIWSWILGILPLVCQIALYSVFASDVSDGDSKRKVYLKNLKTAIVLTLEFIAVIPARKLQYAAGSGTLIVLWLMAAVIMFALGFSLFQTDKFKDFIKILDKGLLSVLTGEKPYKQGDIVLCRIKEEVEAGAKDPREILPQKDRFLHMLILGPTGCGKTSQILLPMIWQDIQNPGWGVTVLEPKGDLAIKVAAMAEEAGRPFLYFDPSYKQCAKFNPLAGREVDVVENIATTFKMLNPDSPQFFLDLNEQLMRNAVKVLKRLDKACGIEGKYANFICLSQLLQNTDGKGRDFITEFKKISGPIESENKENTDIAAWFMNDYFPERSKVYENTSGVRSQVSKLISNEYLREVLNPDVSLGESNELNFDTHLMNGGVICISTAQGTLRDLSKYLGYFLILTLQSSVFRRPGTEDTRRPHSLYIDEFQTYSTPGFADMLTQGRSYRVSSILATQARAQMAMGGGKDGKNFVELVSANARNVILFPGINKDDAKYYSEQFGETEHVETVVSESKKKWGGFMTGTESTREQKSMVANFSSTDLVFGADKGKSFGEITYCIIKNNSIQPAKTGLISYIPYDLNKKLDVWIQDYSKANQRESAADYYAREQAEQTDEPVELADDTPIDFSKHDEDPIDFTTHEPRTSEVTLDFDDLDINEGKESQSVTMQDVEVITSEDLDLEAEFDEVDEIDEI